MLAGKRAQRLARIWRERGGVVRTSVSLRDRFLLSIAAQATASLIGARTDPAVQVRLLGAKDTLAQVTGATRMWEQLPGGQDTTALRERLIQGEEAWKAAHREGRSLSFGTVAPLALHLLDDLAQELPQYEAARDGAQ